MLSKYNVSPALISLLLPLNALPPALVVYILKFAFGVAVYNVIKSVLVTLAVLPSPEPLVFLAVITRS